MNQPAAYRLGKSSRAHLFPGVLLSAVLVLGQAAVGCDGGRGAPTSATKAVPEAAVVKTAVLDPHCSDPGSCGSGPSQQGFYRVPIGDSPAIGGAQPKVTVVAFSDFQCPFCQQAAKTLAQLRKEYGDELRVVLKHRPLPFHDRARPAALAAEAAAQQGKFWEMHDALFATSPQLSEPELERQAQELGIDLARWHKDARSERTQARVDSDAQLADQLGVRGTPTFLINGHLLVGAQPLAAFKAIADAEIVKAGALLHAGVPRAQLYEKLTAGGAEQAPPPPPPPAPSSEVVKVLVGDSATLGPADALVTIVEFSDFECPFCARIETTLNTLGEEYKGRVRFVWKDMPLPFHSHAMLAAIAAREAKAQGKFWEMKRMLMANQAALDRTALERYAQELGLDLVRFRAALDSQQWKSGIATDVAQAAQLGVQGTPVFFINGIRVTGAQKTEAFRTLIDQQLKKAEGLLAQGVARERVYETLMRAAHSPVDR